MNFKKRYLNNNQLSGTIPNFGNGILQLNLANNQLYGSIPYTIQYSSSLYSLFVLFYSLYLFI